MLPPVHCDNSERDPVIDLTRRRVPWHPPFGLILTSDPSSNILRIREPFAFHAIMTAAMAPVLFLIAFVYNLLLPGLPRGLLLLLGGISLFLSVGSLIEAHVRCRRTILSRHTQAGASEYPVITVHPCNVSTNGQTFVGRACVLWMSADDFSWAAIVADDALERELEKLPTWFRARVVESDTPIFAQGFR